MDISDKEDNLLEINLLVEGERRFKEMEVYIVYLWK